MVRTSVFVTVKSLIRVLWVADHIGYPGGVIHGGQTYHLTVFPRLHADIVTVLAVLRDSRSSAENYRQIGIEPIFLGRTKWDPRGLIDIQHLIRDHDIDILHLGGIKAQVLGRAASRIARKPAVIHLHHMLPMSLPIRVFHQLLGQGNDQFIAVSAAVQRHASRMFSVPEDKVEVLYNGIDVDKFAAIPSNTRARLRATFAVAEKTPVIGVFGRVNADKGQTVLIKAMPQVLHARPEAVLLVVGEGPDLGRCMNLAADLGVDRAIRYLHYRQDVPELLAAVDLVIVPSMWEEALAFAVLEAAAAGRPVVAFNSGGIPEMVRDGETGYLVEKGNVQQLASTITTLLNNDELRETMGKAAATDVRRFSLEPHVQRLEEIYRRLSSDADRFA